ncbi:hypothetical protein [Lysinibacillus xylanilyticus]|uniref:hypothetical protein n=1 Tax=Lysinibacillus xylanilyticus TaxID=582475 RepID=UPI0037F4B228
MAITIKKETLKNGTTSYKFVVNLGIPEGETKPRIVNVEAFHLQKKQNKSSKSYRPKRLLAFIPRKNSAVQINLLM